MNEWEMRGKERSPEQTIAKVNEILASLGLTAHVKDMDRDVEDCYSCRVTVDGPTDGLIGTNGKGMSEQLCHASAYGELMERLSNRLFNSMIRLDDPDIEDMHIEEHPLYDVWSEEQPYVAQYLKDRIVQTVTDDHPFLSKEYLVNLALEKLTPDKLGGKSLTVPYYSVLDDKFEYLPMWTITFTGSNGMAAGNTLEEALVEGISELLERYSQMQIFDGDIIPPQVPREYIARFPHILKIIDDIESTGRYKVRVLDCSLGKKLPVVCGVVADLKTGGFGVKFGAQPNIAIAMERVFTELMQGSRLEYSTNLSSPDFARFKASRRLDKWNSIKVASTSMPAQLLMDDATYSFEPWEDVSAKTNPEIMKSMIALMESFGSKVFVRDASYLGFPAVNIYATIFSEVRPVDMLELKHNILAKSVQEYFTRIDTLADKEVLDLAVYAASKRGSVIENSINAISQLFFTEKFMFEPFDADMLYCACLIRLGKHREAASVLSFLVSMKDIMSDEDDKLLVRAAYTWENGIAEGETPDHVYQAVKNLYPAFADKVRDVFGDPAHILEKLYPVCGSKPCTEITEGGCRYSAIHDIYKLLVDAERKNPVDPENIRAVFRGK